MEESRGAGMVSMRLDEEGERRRMEMHCRKISDRTSFKVGHFWSQYVESAPLQGGRALRDEVENMCFIFCK